MRFIHPPPPTQFWVGPQKSRIGTDPNQLLCWIDSLTLNVNNLPVFPPHWDFRWSCTEIHHKYYLKCFSIVIENVIFGSKLFPESCTLVCDFAEVFCEMVLWLEKQTVLSSNFEQLPSNKQVFWRMSNLSSICLEELEAERGRKDHLRYVFWHCYCIEQKAEEICWLNESLWKTVLLKKALNMS